MKRLLWLGYAVGLFLVYATVVPRLEQVIPEGLLTIFQSHRVIGEDFLLRKDRPAAVLVGTSLSSLLPRIALAPVYNLAMSGGSSLAGMRLLMATEPAPRVLFIEANLFIRPADEDLLAELLNPVALRIKSICDACLARNQPVTLALSIVSNLRLRPLSESEQDRLNVTVAANPEVQRRGLTMHLKGSDSPVSPDKMRTVLDALSLQIRELEQKGTRVIFVEMPMHPDLIGAAYYQSGLAAAKAKFSPLLHQWISFTGRNFETSDGAHLIYRDAREVAAELSSIANSALR